jgi:hypothetical protein
MQLPYDKLNDSKKIWPNDDGSYWSHHHVVPREVLIHLSTYSHASINNGIHSEKFIIRQFCCRANVTECTYTNLDSVAYYKPTLYGIAYFS